MAEYRFTRSPLGDWTICDVVLDPDGGGWLVAPDNPQLALGVALELRLEGRTFSALIELQPVPCGGGAVRIRLKDPRHAARD